MDAIKKDLLMKVADLHEVPQGAYNIRENGKLGGRAVTENINIVTKEDKPGIDIYIKDGTKKESLHIPVIISETGVSDLVYNDFYVGEDCDVVIVAGCGIHNTGDEKSEHDGIHTFHVGKNSRVKYVEKHYGDGVGSGDNVMNPTTVIFMEEDSYLEMETVQIKGITSTDRKTSAVLKDGAVLEVHEKIMTNGTQFAKTDFVVDLDGENCSANVVSRSVAKDKSFQEFVSEIKGNNRCNGHTECDAIIMDDARVVAVPKLEAAHVDASLIHEAAIGKIAGEQLTKLMTLGLTEAEAEEHIIKGFLK